MVVCNCEMSPYEVREDGAEMSYWEATGKSNDWFTPPEVFEALGCTFDLDVAGNFRAKVPSKGAIYSDGLTSQWSGFIWMNPPFGGRNGIAPWLDRFIFHGNGIALTPDRTSAPWFQDAMPHMGAILFTPKLKFIRPDGTRGQSPSNGTALMAIGSLGQSALRRAAEKGLGVLCSPNLRNQ